MDQMDLNIGIPLFIQDQNETVVYMGNPDIADSDSLIVNEYNETLLVNQENETEDNPDVTENETLIINHEDIKDETLIFKSDGEELILNNHFLQGDCNGDVNNEASDAEVNVNDKNEGTDGSTLVIENLAGSPMVLNGQMIQLPDGTTAFIENPTNSENEVYTPIKMPDGTVVYVVAGTLDNSVARQQNWILNESSENNEENDNSGSGSKTEKTKGFQCNYKNCNKSYSSFHHLKVHLRVHTGDRPFRCDVEGCNKAFSTGFGLKTHQRTHNGERPYTCNHENCEKGFKTSGDLQKHIRTHTGERPFLCPIPNCGRSFTTCNICKVHVRTHTGERPYKCTYPDCNKTFASVTNQRNHLRIHSGEKPYVCAFESCGRRFTEYSSLYKHNMVHRQQPHSCQICGKSYRQASGLLMHTKSAHGDQEETFLMLDKSPSEEISPTDESTAIFLVDNIKLEDNVLEDQLFSDLRETHSSNGGNTQFNMELQF